MPGLIEPNPHVISRTLMRRREFVPATTLNLLAAAWIQFQMHDWFTHGREPDDPIEVDLPDGHAWPENPMRIPRTRQDPTRADRTPTCRRPTSTARRTGGTPPASTAAPRRSSGACARFRTASWSSRTAACRSTLDRHRDHRLQRELVGRPRHAAHAVHARAQRDLRPPEGGPPELDDDELFDTARLVNSALIAKIHTVEWTPAIVAHPALKVGMRANWWGLMGERLHRLFGRIGENEVISGIPGSPADHHGAPYQLTEEFVSVYRLHPLLPDELEVHSRRGRPAARRSAVRGRHPQERRGP